MSGPSNLTSDQNVGHGWVRPRPDGAKAKCGGPAICRECATEAGIPLPEVEEALLFFDIRPLGQHKWALCEPREALDMIGDEIYEIKRVRMTRKEFEALEEFDGW